MGVLQHSNEVGQLGMVSVRDAQGDVVEETRSTDMEPCRADQRACSESGFVLQLLNDQKLHFCR